MIYSEETFVNVIEELKPLLVEHYKEVAMYQDKIELNPDYDLYKALDLMGNLKIYTMRTDDELTGYNVFFIKDHIHYKDHKFAINDVVYIHPDYRHDVDTPNFINYCEDKLKEEGVSVVTYHMKEHKPFHTLMGFLGYDHAEHLYTKYIER